jgi:hypothetical protein
MILFNIFKNSEPSPDITLWYPPTYLRTVHPVLISPYGIHQRCQERRGGSRGSKEERKARKKAEHSRKVSEEDQRAKGRTKLAEETEVFSKVWQGLRSALNLLQGMARSLKCFESFPRYGKAFSVL